MIRKSGEPCPVVRNRSRRISAPSMRGSSSVTSTGLPAVRSFVSVKNGTWAWLGLTPPQCNCCTHAGLAGLGFQRLGSTSLTSWFFMAGKRLSTSVRYSWGLIPRRLQL